MMANKSGPETGQPRTHREASARARERMCLVTRRKASETDLIRFVVDPEGVLVPDVKAVLPGRGAWVSADRDVLAQAIKRKAFGRALKTDTPIGGLDTLIARTQQVVRHHAHGGLAMARKAGLVVTGFSKVESALKTGKAHTVLVATDGGADSASKIHRLAGHVGVPVLQLLPHDEMGLALGREHVIHAALLDGPGAQRFLAPLRRLENFCLPQAQNTQAQELLAQELPAQDLQAGDPPADDNRSTHTRDGVAQAKAPATPILGDKTAV